MTQLIQKVGNHTVTVTAEVEQISTPRHINYSILIDGFLFSQEQEDTDNGRYSEQDCAKFRLRDTSEMLAAGMFRRLGSTWQLAQNAEYPVPANYRPEWPGKPFEILFDNGGGALLQHPDYCHSYDRAEQLAEDVFAILNGKDPADFDGNEPEYRRDRHREDDVVTSDEIIRHLTEGTTTDDGGHTQNEFWTAIHCLNTPDLGNIATASGKTLVYHRSEAGRPRAFTDASGLWHFEPRNYAGGDPYSSGYPTRDAALAAAERDEAQPTPEPEPDPEAYKVTHGGRPGWRRFAATHDEALAIIRKETGGYMDDEPFDIDNDGVERWNESPEDNCYTYAIERTRYQIGTLDRWHKFHSDALGNDPADTTFDTAEAAVQAINDLIEAKVFEDMSNAVVQQTTTGRIVWQQESK